MAFLAAALPAMADLGAAGSAAAAGTGAAADAAATAAAASPEIAGAGAVGSVLTNGAIPSVGDLLSMSGASSEGLSGMIGGAINSLPSADTLKSFATGSGTDISDIIKSFTGQQAAHQPTQPPMPQPHQRGQGTSINVPPLISAQGPNPRAISEITSGLASSNQNQQLMQLVKALLSGKQSGLSI